MTIQEFQVRPFRLYLYNKEHSRIDFTDTSTYTDKILQFLHSRIPSKTTNFSIPNIKSIPKRVKQIIKITDSFPIPLSIIKSTSKQIKNNPIPSNTISYTIIHSLKGKIKIEINISLLLDFFEGTIPYALLQDFKKTRESIRANFYKFSIKDVKNEHEF